MWTFPKWYYFKKGTVAEREFSKAQKYPIPNHRNVWFPKGVPDLKHGRDRRFKQDIILPKKNNDIEVSTTTDGGDESAASELQNLDDIGRPIKANSRITIFDEKNDQTSLERKLPRTLYLLIKNNNEWTFPSFEVSNDQISKGLHNIAEEGLRNIGGDKINTWTVSNTPAALIKHNNGINEFLIKSHIIAGKFDPTNKSEYKWLTKEEIQDIVSDEYYSKINHLLSQ